MSRVPSSKSSAMWILIYEKLINVIYDLDDLFLTLPRVHIKYLWMKKKLLYKYSYNDKS